MAKVKVTDELVKDVLKQMLNDWAFFLPSIGREPNVPVTLELRLGEVIEEYVGLRTWTWEIRNIANCMYESKNALQKLLGPHWLVLDFFAYETHDQGREYDLLIRAKHYVAHERD